MLSTHQINTSWSFLKGFEAFPPENVHHAAFSSGMEMLSMDFTADSSSEHVVSIDQSPISFSFHISGHVQGEVVHSMTRSEYVTSEPGKTGIFFTPESRFRTKLFDRQHYRVITIYIDPHCLREKLDEEMDQVPAGLHEILQNSAQLPYNQKINTTPHIRMVLDQIFNCPYHGALKKLFLECKSVELMISQLSEAAQAPVENRRPRLQPLDRERIHFAKEILLSDMGNPPSLHDLAKKSGLNENKLNRGFKQEFGTTVYKFYQMHRIKRAKEILDEGRLNIDETAHFLGFFDTTHFIKHFKNYFGTTPGIYFKNGPSGQ